MDAVMIPCPFDPAVDADECCGTAATDCCDGRKADCTTARALDANGDVDVVACAIGHGCNTYAQAVVPDPTPAEIEADARANEAETYG